MKFSKNGNRFYALQSCHYLQVCYCQLRAVSDAIESGFGKGTAKKLFLACHAPRHMLLLLPEVRVPVVTHSKLFPPPSPHLALLVWERIVHWIYVKMEICPFPQPASLPYLAGHDEEKKADNKAQHPCSPPTVLEMVAFLWQHTLQFCHIHISSGTAHCCNAGISKTVVCATCTVCTW